MTITETPKLDKKSSKRFLEKINKNLRTTSAPIPTPKIKSAIKIIMKDAYKAKK